MKWERIYAGAPEGWIAGYVSGAWSIGKYVSPENSELLVQKQGSERASWWELYHGEEFVAKYKTLKAAQAAAEEISHNGRVIAAAQQEKAAKAATESEKHRAESVEERE